MAQTFKIKKIDRNHGIKAYKKALKGEHRTNYILRDINYFVKISVSMFPNFGYALAQKLV